MKNQHNTGDNMFEKFMWTINNFSKVANFKELCSETFFIGGHPSWQIILYPRGNNADGYLSLHLYAGDLSIFPNDCSIFANFKLALVNQVNGKKTITEEYEHQFNESEPVYGWHECIPLVELRNSKSGFIMNDTCIVVAEIAVRKEENVNHGKFVDFKGFGKIEKAFVPLLEEVCSLHPSLIDCQQKRSRRFTEWAFMALGQVLHFLRTRKVKDMNADACTQLQILWEELETFNFDLTWLQPHVQSALSMKSYIEKTVHLKTMKENLASLKMETKSLKEKIFTAEVDLEIARRDYLAQGLEERDLDAELAYGGP